MSLRDYRNDSSDLKGKTGEAIQSSMYHQEVTSLKIDKLSNRVTIISIILPVLIGVVVFFSYLDIKERVTDVDTTKNTQVERLNRLIEEKLNALDVRIAKNRFDVDEKLPLLEKKEQALENQVAKMGASKADTAVIEKTVAGIEASLAKLDKRIRNNASQDNATLAEMERINQSLTASLGKKADQYQKAADQLAQQLKALEKQVLTQAKEVAAWKTGLAQLKKDVSLMRLQLKTMEQTMVTRKQLEERLKAVKAARAAKSGKPDTVGAAASFQENTAASAAPAPHPPSVGGQTVSGPKPQLNLEGMDTISQETLTQ